MTSKKQNDLWLISMSSDCQGNLIFVGTVMEERPIGPSDPVVVDKEFILRNHLQHFNNKCNIAIKTIYSLINRNSQLSTKNKIRLCKLIFQSMTLRACPVWGGFITLIGDFQIVDFPSLCKSYTLYEFSQFFISLYI